MSETDCNKSGKRARVSQDDGDVIRVSLKNDSKGLKLLKGLQLIMLLGFFAIGLLATGGVAICIKAVSGLGERGALLLTSTMQCLLAFCLPALLMARFSMKDPLGWLGLKNAPPFKALIGVLIVYILALPAMNQIISWNESITFPEGMRGLEESLRASENAARTISEIILNGLGFWSMIGAVCVVGLLTGLSEEMFFRGGLQNTLTMPGKHTFAVWAAAIVFSAVHFQFYGFVPRVLMGVFFGYLLVWTGSLWVPVIAHAFNNSIVVVSSYLICSDRGMPNLDTIGVSQTGEIPWDAMFSAAATFVFLWKFRRFFFKSHTP